MTREMLCVVFAVIAGCFYGHTVSADDAGRCARLFDEQPAIDTCNTLANMSAGKLSDSDLRERVSQSIYGMSAEDVEKDRPRREEAKRKAVAEKEAAALAEDPQCYRLFVEPNERKECRLLGALTSRQRTDDEMREAVRARLGSIRIDEEHTRAAIQAEQKRKEEEKAAEEKRKRAATVAEQRRKDESKRASERIDARLRQGPIGFALKGWELGGFGNVMTIHFALQNNTSKPQKDFVISCETHGRSGTLLSRPRVALYEALQPGTRRAFELNMGFVHSQSARASCSVVKWTTS